jgi:hypothetical protein
MDLTTELAAIIDALDAAGIPYALCGGLVVAIYGYPRFTRDIDLLIREESLSGVLTAVNALGYNLEGGRLPMGEDEAHPLDIVRISKAQGRDLLTLDLLIVSDHLEPVWQTRTSVPWNSRQMSIVSKSGLMTLKRLANRRQDVIDLEQLSKNDVPE